MSLMGDSLLPEKIKKNHVRQDDRDGPRGCRKAICTCGWESAPASYQRLGKMFNDHRNNELEWLAIAARIEVLGW